MSTTIQTTITLSSSSYGKSGDYVARINGPYFGQPGERRPSLTPGEVAS